jgi:phage tail protein X
MPTRPVNENSPNNLNDPDQVITIQSERWDQLSTRVYGRADRYQLIIDSNPQLDNQVKFAPVLPSGLVLIVPPLVGGEGGEAEGEGVADHNTTAEPVGLAPWRR